MRNSDWKLPAWLERTKKAFFPLLAGLAVFTIYPSITSYQDIASISGSENRPEDEKRWLAHIPQSEGISQLKPVVAADASAAPRAGMIDNTVTGSIEVRQKQQKSPRLDPARIEVGVDTKTTPQTVNRSLKGGRVVSATIKRPPAYFSAGSVAERHSFLAPALVQKDMEMAFVKAKPAKEAMLVASTFQIKKPKTEKPEIKPDLPVMVASLVRESRSNLLAFNPEPKLKRSPFAAILEDENKPVNLIPKLDKRDHKWAINPLPKNSWSKKQQNCLAAGIYFESRGESVRGQAAVSQVILNRVRNPSYPNSICGVVYQNKNWRNRCQFSFACDRIRDRVKDSGRWKLAKYVARETTEGRIWLKQVGSSTHYHATYVRPRWARSMKRVGRIGLHIFYRTHGGGWS